MNLLVIEDSCEVRQRLCQLLAGIPRVNVVEKTTLAAGMEQLRLDPPDIVILDIHLPDGDGMQVLRTAKRDFPATQVFVFTNHVFHRRQCQAEGADRFFDKSMEFVALLEAVRNEPIV
ncbi:MAG: response regulator transcription factor [Sterolibacterium sp.]|nr:response regulator transcription factor [Sterolibacterium sp.]